LKVDRLFIISLIATKTIIGGEVLPKHSIAENKRETIHNEKSKFGGKISITYNSMGEKKLLTNLEDGDNFFKVDGGFGYKRINLYQYKDGEGNNFSQQVDNIVSSSFFIGNKGIKYINPDISDFEKKSWWLNFTITPSDKHKIKVGYFGSRRNNTLYPVFAMDSILDKTSRFTFQYKGYNLSNYSSRLKINYVHSEVNRDMSTKYRLSSTFGGSQTNYIDSQVDKIKLKNHFFIANHKIVLGGDFTKKSLNGTIFSDSSGSPLYDVIPDIETQNIGFYGSVTHFSKNYDLTLGLRFDEVQIDANSLDRVYQDVKSIYQGKKSRNFSNWSLNLSEKYRIGDNSSISAKVGYSTIFPTEKELYMNRANPKGVMTIRGNPNLKEATNQEANLGFKTRILDGDFSFNIFYNRLQDFIYGYSNNGCLDFTNIDATIYGLNAKYSKQLSKSWKTDLNITYQQGRKDKAIEGQTDKDLAEIPPLKFSSKLEYFKKFYTLQFEVIATDKQRVDGDNGERNTPGYVIANIKGNYKFSKSLQMDIGVDNIFNKTYAINNFYLGKKVKPTSSDSSFILNEMGRNFFVNLSYKF